MVKREIYSVGLKRKVEAEVTDVIVSPTKGGGQRFQVVGIFEEDGKQHKCQSMIGAAAAQELAATLGINLNQPATEAAEEEETVVMSAEEDSSVTVSEPTEVESVEEFDAEDTATEEPAESTEEPAPAVAEEPKLLVPEPSTYPTGDGRAIGAHTGLNIAASVGGDMSLPPTDYVWIGRAEEPLPEDDADYLFEDMGEETFLVHTSLKNYLAEQYWEEILEGLLHIRVAPQEDEWIITFAPWLMNDIISSISDFQSMDVEIQQVFLNDPDDDAQYGINYDFNWEMDEDLADWVRAEEFNARGLVDIDDMLEDNSDWRPAAAIGAALLAIGVSYWWANKK